MTPDEKDILIAVLEKQRDQAMSALAQAIAGAEILSRRLSEIEKARADERA